VLDRNEVNSGGDLAFETQSDRKNILGEPVMEVDPAEDDRKGRLLSNQSGEETREDRVRIARDGERAFRRRVGWGARCGGELKLFTTASVPVMTRLRMPERSILDTLVAGGVARSRSDALAWCVKLVGMHQADWIKGLRDALVKVDEVRNRGPLN